MIDRSDDNARTFFDIRVLGRLVSLSLLFAAVSVAAAHAETKNVKIMMDWIIQGTHAPFFVAQDKGYFKAAGVTVDAIDAGRAPPMSPSASPAGSTNSAGSICLR